MAVLVMRVREVRVPVDERSMSMHMRVRLSWRLRVDMLVPVMLVVHVTVLMDDTIVLMLVLMVLGQVEPGPHGHARCGGEELNRHPLAEHEHRHRRPEERRQGEVRRRPRRAQRAQRDDEEHEAHP